MKEAERSNDRLTSVDLDHSRTGDSSDFWELWKEHEAYLFRICLHQLGGIEEDAEDALGVLMVKLLDLMPRYGDRIENLRAWLTRITYNVCIDIRRELHRKWNLQSIDDLAASDGAIFLSPTESPEEGALRRESARHVSHAIEELWPELRIPFLLHYLYFDRYDVCGASASRIFAVLTRESIGGARPVPIMPDTPSKEPADQIAESVQDTLHLVYSGKRNNWFAAGVTASEQSMARAVQAIGQTTAIVIQDAAEMLRNINTVEVTAIGAATTKWILRETLRIRKQS